MDQPKIAAVILAAGNSRRMGRFKPLLTLGDETLIEKDIFLFREAGISDIRVVAGRDRDLLRPLLTREGVRMIVNPDPHSEMFASVCLGIGDLEPAVQAAFILPADVPLVRPWTVRRLLERFRRERDRILIPCFHQRSGHPVVIPARYFSAVSQWTGEKGLKGALDRLAGGTVRVPVADGNILLDLDTPADHAALQERWQRRHIPTLLECEAILRDIAGADEGVLAHGRAVAEVAAGIADALAAAGCRLDRDALVVAALLHGLAEGAPRHAQEAAQLLAAMGFAGVAEMVAAHIDIECSARGAMTGAEVLYLADKLVQDGRRVSPAKRFQGAARRRGHDAQLRARPCGRLENAVAIAQKVEKMIGRAAGTRQKSKPTKKDARAAGSLELKGKGGYRHAGVQHSGG